MARQLPDVVPANRLSCQPCAGSALAEESPLAQGDTPFLEQPVSNDWLRLIRM